MKSHIAALALLFLTLWGGGALAANPVDSGERRSQGRDGTAYTLHPRRYERLIEDRSTEISTLLNNSERLHDLLPEFPTSPKLQIELHCPSVIKITTHAETFSWDDVQFPITFMAFLDNKHWQMRYDRQIVFLKNRENGKIYSFCPDIRKHDLLPQRPVSPLGPGYISAYFTYNIFYFYKDLPRRSATYEIWVQLGDIESNRRRFLMKVSTTPKEKLLPE